MREKHFVQLKMREQHMKKAKMQNLIETLKMQLHFVICSQGKCFGVVHEDATGKLKLVEEFYRELFSDATSCDSLGWIHGRWDEDSGTASCELQSRHLGRYMRPQYDTKPCRLADDIAQTKRPPLVVAKV